MFVVLYRWYVRPGMEDQFRATWCRATECIRRKYGGLGSRLHREADGAFVASAEWPDEASWRVAFDQGMAYDDPENQAAFLATLSHDSPTLAPVMMMTVTDDLLARTERAEG